MNFLHPWAIPLGLIGASIPLLVHWLTRPRPVRLPLSTLRFVEEAVRQRRARHRLRDAIILLLRMAAVGLIAAAFARPLFGERPVVAARDDAAATRVVIVDQSLSMAAAAGGIPAFERARGEAVKYLTHRPGLHVNLILAGARPRAVFDQPSSNASALRDALAEARPRPERLDLDAAVALAAEMLSEHGTEGERSELVVLSDFQRSQWAAADFSPLPEGTSIQLEGVAPSETPVNLAVLGVRARGGLQSHHQIRVEVEVGNFSTTRRDVTVELAVGEARYRLEGTCPEHARATLATDIPGAQVGWMTCEARLAGVQDAIAVDDARPFVLEVHPIPTILLITRERADQPGASSFFLERGLAPSQRRNGKASTRLVRLDPADIDRRTLAGADLIVLDHAGKLPAERVGLLASFMTRGRPILYVAAEPVDATNLAMLAEAAGSALQMPVEFIPPPQDRARRDLFLAEVRGSASPFNVFGDSLTRLLTPLRFAGGLASRQVEGALADDVLASFSDRSACLVSTTCGIGSLAVLNVDLARSNFQYSPAFVPILGELVNHMMRRRRVEAAFLCGEPLTVYAPPTAESVDTLTIAGPANEPGALTEEGGTILWQWAEPAPPGVYSLRRAEQTLMAVAVAAPPEESDLRTLDPRVLETRVAGPRTVGFRSATTDAGATEDAWSWIAVVCCVCMLLELAVLRTFRT